jgi:ribonuclease R
MRDRVGEEFEATVSGVAPHGVYCSFDSPFVEVLCHVTALGQDFFELDQHGLRLVGRRSGMSFGLGDRLRVRLDSVNLTERSITGSPVQYARSEQQADAQAHAGFELPRRKPRRNDRAEPERGARDRESAAPRRGAPPQRGEDEKRARRRERRTRDERKVDKQRRR